MLKDIMQYGCKICNKQYASYQSLWNHNKKFHKKCVTSNVTNGKDLGNKW